MLKLKPDLVEALERKLLCGKARVKWERTKTMGSRCQRQDHIPHFHPKAKPPVVCCK